VSLVSAVVSVACYRISLIKKIIITSPPFESLIAAFPDPELIILGTLAEYCLVDADVCARKPNNVLHKACASVPLVLSLFFSLKQIFLFLCLHWHLCCRGGEETGVLARNAFLLFCLSVAA
jgi:hypothetical protein